MDSAPPVETPAAPAAAEPASPKETGAPAARAKASAQRFDFRHPVFLSSGEWRKVRMEVQEFVESAAALLSTWLRIDLTLQLAKLDTINYNEFTSALPSPTHITLFKLEPLRGVCLLEVRSALALSAVDRLLGGPGQATALDRNLTEMEIALMDQFGQVLLDEWCKQWTRFQEMRPEILGHENNPRFLQSSNGDSVMLAVTLDARLADCEGQIQIAIPYNTIEPLISKVTHTIPAAPATAPAAPPAPKWNRSLDQVPLTITARWPVFKVGTRALINLKPGEVLSLEPDGAEKIQLRIGSVVKFQGRLGTHEKKWAVQITDVNKS